MYTVFCVNITYLPTYYFFFDSYSTHIVFLLRLDQHLTSKYGLVGIKVQCHWASQNPWKSNFFLLVELLKCLGFYCQASLGLSLSLSWHLSCAWGSQCVWLSKQASQCLIPQANNIVDIFSTCLADNVLQRYGYCNCYKWLLYLQICK